jgi:hypothetical protein
VFGLNEVWKATYEKIKCCITHKIWILTIFFCNNCVKQHAKTQIHATLNQWWWYFYNIQYHKNQTWEVSCLWRNLIPEGLTYSIVLCYVLTWNATCIYC